MRAQVKSKANALIAAIMAAIFAFSLSGVPASALAEGETTPSVQGVDFLQPSAKGWELLKVDNLGDQAIYITVYKQEGTDKSKIQLGAPMRFTAENFKSQEQVAQLVALQIFNNTDNKGDTNAAQTAYDAFGNANERATYTIEVASQLMGGHQSLRRHDLSCLREGWQ